MASAAYLQTIPTTKTKIFNANTDGGKVGGFLVCCPQLSSKDVLINIPGLHKEDEWYLLCKDCEQEFILEPAGIAVVYAKGYGGNTDINYCVSRRFF